MGRRIGALVMMLSILSPMALALTGCQTQRGDVRRETRVEERSEDRYERRHGND